VKRREFISMLGSAAATWPLAAHAQPVAAPVVGFVNAGSLEGYRPMVAAFRQSLQESGYTEGRDIVIEYHWAEGKNDRLRAIVTDLVRRQVAIIVATRGAPRQPDQSGGRREFVEGDAVGCRNSRVGAPYSECEQ
jgi:putative tryptophan/tyrosine transport system substrate-binding protein